MEATASCAVLDAYHSTSARRSARPCRAAAGRSASSAVDGLRDAGRDADPRIGADPWIVTVRPHKHKRGARARAVPGAAVVAERREGAARETGLLVEVEHDARDVLELGARGEVP